jgi:hypothetical protein
MPQPIPLTTDLRIKSPNIIIHDAGRLMNHIVMKKRALKKRFLARGLRVQGPV